MSARRTVLLAALLLAPLPARAGAPDWVRDAIAPASGTRDTNVVRLRDVFVRVAPDGSFGVRTRFVERSDAAWAPHAAIASAGYVRGTCSVRSFRAWTIAPDGKVTEWNDDRAADIATERGMLYTDGRARVLDASSGVSPGAAFAYETVVEYAPGFLTLRPVLQGREATRLSRVALLLPAGWRATATPLHGADVVASVAGDTLRWTAANLAAIPAERFGVPLALQAPALGLAWHPPAPVRGTQDFAGWPDVAAWYHALSDPGTRPGPAVEERARSLAPAGADAWTVARRLARAAQAVRYVGIEIGIGGYRPHAAEDVLRDGYGDCKDKAGLLRALLAARGIPAWLVMVHSADPLAVDEGWPSPLQFDHCITAIALPGAERRAGGLVHPVLGPLLFFDPTDPFTPFGDLPPSERGGLAVLAADPGGGAVRLPVAPPQAEGIERDVEVRLAADGSADLRVVERSRGDEAVRRRAERAEASPAEYERSVRQWSERGLPGVDWSALETADAPDSNAFRIELRGHARSIGRPLPGGSVALSPIALGRIVAGEPFATPRRTPLRLPRDREVERVRVHLPPGWTAEDLPDAVSAETDAGRFALACIAGGDSVRCESRLELAGRRLPADRAAEFTRLLDAAAAAGRSSFVLSPPAAR